MENDEKHTTILGVEDHNAERIIVYRQIAGFDIPSPNSMPKVTLAIRAAEYGLHIEDPMALDILLLEGFYWETPTPVVDEDYHPLYTAETVEHALGVVSGRIEDVRVDRGSPHEDTGNRMLANAVKNKAASKGLVQVRDVLLHHASRAKDVYLRTADTRDELRAIASTRAEWQDDRPAGVRGSSTTDPGPRPENRRPERSARHATGL